MAIQLALGLPAGVLLARVLRPSDFGLSALALLITRFITVACDLGLGAAIIQRRELTDRHRRVAITGAFVLGLLIAGVVTACAPAIGFLSQSPEIVPLVRVLSIVFITASCGAVARSELLRRFEFRKLCIIDVTSYTAGYALVSIVGALCGLGVWSLILGNLAMESVSCLLCVVTARMILRPLLALRELTDLFGYGVGVSANNLVSYLGRNGDNFLVGRTLGAAALGYYSRAFNLMTMPLTYVTDSFFHVLLPTFAEMQDERARMGRGFLMSIQFACILVAPVAVGMIVAAQHLVLGLYGRQWSGAVVPLQVLCVAAVPRAGIALAAAVNRACNQVVAEMWLQCAYAAAIAAATIAGSRSGIVLVAWLVSLAIGAMYAAVSALAVRATGLRWYDFASAHVAGFVISAVCALAAIATQSLLEALRWSHLAILGAVVFSSGIAVLLGVYLLPRRVRPSDLFSRLAQQLKTLPAPFRNMGMFVLRVSAPVPPQC